MSELKPCPFCGGEAKIGDASVYCNDCPAIVWAWPYEDIESAITTWNRRAQQPNKPLALEKLKQMDGEPVWCTWINGWALIYIDGNSELEFVYHDGSYHTFDELKHLLHECELPFITYDHKPEEGEK